MIEMDALTISCSNRDCHLVERWTRLQQSGGSPARERTFFVANRHVQAVQEPVVVD
jgi:hypothetical protein